MEARSQSRWFRWVEGGLLLYVLLLPLRRLLRLPVVEAKLQPPEFLFPVLFVLVLLHFGRRLLSAWRWWYAGLLLYLGVLTWSTWRAGHLGGYLEWLGRGYLLAVGLMFCAYVRETGRDGVTKLLRAWAGGVAIGAVLIYGGYLLALLGWDNRLLLVHENYPYLGTVWRASGLAGGPTAVVFLGILPTVYAWLQWRAGESRWGWWLLLLFPVFLLTFSKEVLLLGLAVLVADRRLLFGFRWAFWPLVVGVSLVYWFGTHYIVQPVQEFAGSYLDGEEFSSGRIVWRGSDWQLLETSYTAIKRACWWVATEQPGGVGADQFPRQLPALKASGQYPTHLPDYVPHSTWFGALAETGFIGFAGLLVFIYGLGKTVRKYGSDEPEERALWGFLCILLIGGMSMDYLSLRCVWVPVGMALGLYFWRRENPADA
ncbi:MAG: hypothetical protein AAFN92_06015 [Bacteroidota bacterium]